MYSILGFRVPITSVRARGEGAEGSKGTQRGAKGGEGSEGGQRGAKRGEGERRGAKGSKGEQSVFYTRF